MQLSLTILGSSSAIPLSNRFPSCQFLNLSDRHFLIDCGEGAQIQLRKNGIGFSRINHIMISHLHGDHFYGLLPLLATMHLLDRQKEVHIYAPPELENSLYENLRLSHSKLRYPLIFHPLNMKKKEIIYEDKAVKVSSFPVKHSLPCCGFFFEEKPRLRKVIIEKLDDLGISGPDIKKIKEGADWQKEDGQIILNEQLTMDPPPPLSYAYCSDTAPLLNLHELLGEKPDILYHEATFMDQHEDRARQTKHSTARQAGVIAQQVHATYLLLGHFSTRYQDLEPLLKEALEEFENSFIAEDNWTYVLKSGKKLSTKYYKD